MAQVKDPYQVLEIERSATDKAIKEAYRKLARKYHPDVNPGDAKAEERFKDIQSAYDLLTDPKRRSTWDQFGAAAFDGSGAAPPRGGSGIPSFDEIFGFGGDLFSHIFGGGGRGGASVPDPRERPRDVEGTMTISLEDAYRGAEREVRYAREVACSGCAGAGTTGTGGGGPCRMCGGTGQTATARGALRVATACQTCRGTGGAPGPPCRTCHGGGRTSVTESIRVRIPAGVEDGGRLRIAGRGTRSGHAVGDLYLRVRIRPHAQFVRDGDDLLVRLPVTITEASLGADVDVPTLDGPARVRVPAGTPSGRKIRLSGRGMARRRGGQGDLYAEIRIVPPPKPTDEERELLERLAKIGTFDPRA